MTVKTIVLKGAGIRKEGKAGGAITPGHLVARNSSNRIVVHPTAADTAQKAFALENELAGKGIDTAYANNDQVFFEILPPGAEVNALVAAGASAIVVGDKLESAGNGTLRKVATDSATDDTERQSIVAIALEAVDNSGGGSAVRIKVEVL